jgi:hypothetical protein
MMSLSYRTCQTNHLLQLATFVSENILQFVIEMQCWRVPCISGIDGYHFLAMKQTKSPMRITNVSDFIHCPENDSS